MAILTALSAGDEAALAAQFGLSDARFTPTALGVENTNYFVEAHEQGEALGAGHPTKWVLTLVEASVDPTRWLLPDLLDALQRSGLPTPRLRRTGAGQRWATWNGRVVILCTRLPGAHRERIGAPDCAAIGRYLARQHRAASGLLPRAPEHPRDATWLHARHRALCGELPPWQRALIEDALAEVDTLLARADYRALPDAVVHGDLFRDNALFTEQGLSGVIDFHHAARHKRVFDLAVAINDWCDDVLAGWSEARTRALIGGYASIAPLTPLEHALLPGLLCYAALAFTLSRLQGQRDRPGVYGKSPLPMFNRLARRIAPPWNAVTS